MKIAVGTTSEQKLGYLNEVLGNLCLNAEIVSFDVPSGVSEQPISSKETKTGSINRAKLAFEKAKDADFGMGIEVGYHPNKVGDYKIFCWTSIVDKNSKIISARSHKMLLPEFHQEIVKSNGYLGDHVRRFIAESPSETSKAIGEILRNRKPFIESSIWLALAEWHSKNN